MNEHEVFRGPLEECIKHFSMRFNEAYPKGGRGTHAAKKPIAAFCGVHIASISRWFYDSERLPLGKERIKLICFLELNGYRVTESEKLPNIRRNFAQLLGFNLIDAKEAAELIGYSHSSQLYVYLRGEGGVLKDREQKFWDLWRARRDKLEQAKEEAGRKYRLDFSSNTRSKGPVLKETEPPPSPRRHLATASVDHSDDGLIDIMQGLLKLLDSRLPSGVDDSVCDALRGSSGTILRLSSRLSALSARIVSQG